MKDTNEHIRAIASITAYIQNGWGSSSSFFTDIDKVVGISVKFLKKYPLETDWKDKKMSWGSHIGEFKFNQENIETLLRWSKEDSAILETKIDDYTRDVAVTTAYIYAHCIDTPLNPSYHENIDKCIDNAIKFIEKYPTGTTWEELTLDWEEELYTSFG